MLEHVCCHFHDAAARFGYDAEGLPASALRYSCSQFPPFQFVSRQLHNRRSVRRHCGNHRIYSHSPGAPPSAYNCHAPSPVVRVFSSHFHFSSLFRLRCLVLCDCKRRHSVSEASTARSVEVSADTGVQAFRILKNSLQQVGSCCSRSFLIRFRSDRNPSSWRYRPNDIYQ